MNLTVEANTGITEREKLLNGTHTITFAGESEDGAWSINGSVSWNLGLIDFRGEGDLVLTSRDDDSEIFGTLVEAKGVGASPDESDLALAATYEIDGGSGRYAGTEGTAAAEIALAGDEMRGRWVLTLSSS